MTWLRKVYNISFFFWRYFLFKFIYFNWRLTTLLLYGKTSIWISMQSLWAELIGVFQDYIMFAKRCVTFLIFFCKAIQYNFFLSDWKLNFIYTEYDPRDLMILKEISPEYSLEGLMLKLKLQYFGHLIWRADSLEKTLMVGKIEGRRRRGRQRMRWSDGITDSLDMGLGRSGCWWWAGRPGVLWFMGSQRVGHDWVTELNWIQNLHRFAFIKKIPSKGN